MKLFKRRFLRILLCLALAFSLSLTACNTGDGKDDPDATEEPFENEEGKPYQTDEEGNVVKDADGNPVLAPEPEPDLVGFIYSGSASDGSVNKTFEKARKQLEKNLGSETCYIEGVLVQDFEKAVETLVDYGCNIIVSCSVAFASSCEKTAKDNIKLKFISYGGGTPSYNLSCFQPLLYQPANVCGLTAGYNTVTNNIGIVADTRMYNLWGVLDSFILGVNILHASNLNVHLAYADSDVSADTKEAIDYLTEIKCDVIMVYQNSDYGIKYCESKGVKCVGFAGDLIEIAPNTNLAGFYFNADSYLTQQVRFVQGGVFSGDLTRGDLRSGYVKFIEPNEKIIKEETLTITGELYKVVSEREVIFTGEIRDNLNQVQVPKGAVLIPPEVLQVQWLEYEFRENIRNFSSQREELPPTDFTIKS